MSLEERFDRLTDKVEQMGLQLARVETKLDTRSVRQLSKRVAALERYRWWLAGVGVALLGVEPLVMQAVFNR